MKISALYSPTVTAGPTIRFRTGYERSGYEEREGFSAQITASSHGISINGAWPTYDRHADIETLLALISAAWTAHVLIRTHVDGHSKAKQLVEDFNAGKWGDEVLRRLMAQRETEVAP